MSTLRRWEREGRLVSLRGDYKDARPRYRRADVLAALKLPDAA